MSFVCLVVVCQPLLHCMCVCMHILYILAVFFVYSFALVVDLILLLNGDACMLYESGGNLCLSVS